MKTFVLIGGPNGAGKTTAARILVPEELGLVEFVNADEIARGVSPFDPDAGAFAAGRLVLERIRGLLASRTNFAFESTCAGRGHARWIEGARREGWRFHLLFLWLPSAAAAIQRVEHRARLGGHAVDPPIVERRYWAGLRNLAALYLPMADFASIYDNSDGGRVQVAIRSRPTDPLRICDPARWSTIERSGV